MEGKDGTGRTRVRLAPLGSPTSGLGGWGVRPSMVKRVQEEIQRSMADIRSAGRRGTVEVGISEESDSRSGKSGRSGKKSKDPGQGQGKGQGQGLG